MEYIKNLTADQIPDCVNILLSNPLFQRYNFNDKRARSLFSLAAAEGAKILTISVEQEVVGFVWFVLRGAWDRSGYIRLIAVHPDCQSRGIGKTLMDAAENEISSQVSEVFLLVSDFNTAAQHFYESRGYLQVGCLPGYIVPEIDELIYYKRLDAAAHSR